MTGRISLIAAAGIAALALTASAALAQAPPERRGLSDFALSASTPITAQSLKAERARSEGLNRMYGLGDYATTNGYIDGPERAVPPTTTTPVSVTGSDSEIQWPQIGVGFVVGILLALGLVLGLRYTRVRPLAH